jgi:AcrR family transcriptional regulator
MAADERRAQIKLVARQEFATGGYQGTTTVDVARAAGLSEALVLKHFGSKGALFREAVIEPVLQLLDGIRDENIARLAEGERRSPLDDMRRLNEHLTELAVFVRDNRNLLLTMLGELRNFPEAGAGLAGVLERHVSDLSSSAGQLTATGQYAPFDPRLLTYLSLAGAALVGSIDDEPGEAIGHVVDALFFGLLSDQGRADVSSATQAPRRATPRSKRKQPAAGSPTRKARTPR